MSTKDDICELQARQALADHINEYHWLADLYRWEDWANLFTEDTLFTHGGTGQVIRGRRQAVEQFRPAVEKRFERTQHAIVNLVFELTGDGTATGHGNLIFTGVPKSQLPHENYRAGGFYMWEFVKTDRWRTSRTALEFIWESSILEPLDA